MTVTYNDTPATAPAPRTGILATLRGYLSLLDRSIAAANVYDSLSQLSDAQLARRGLARTEIADVARQVLLDEK